MINKWKLLGSAFAATALILSSCTNKVEPIAPEEPETVNELVFSADLPEGQESDDTKTTLAYDYQILWKTGDQVSVNRTLSNAVASSDNGKRSVSFTVSGSFSAPYKVLYPGNSSSDKVLVLPSTQSYVAGSFDGAAAASFGNAEKRNDKYSVSLTPFCGVLRFALKGSATLSKIELNSLGGEKLYGSFTLPTNGSGLNTDPEASFSGGTAGTLTYNCSGQTLSGSDKYFYICIPAQTYASGIEALVYQADGAYMRLKFWGSGQTLGRGKVVEFESKTFAAGRTENLFAINSLTAENGGEPTAEVRITVATYNVYQEGSREDSGKSYMYLSTENSSYQAVRNALGKAINDTGADIIGFNELDSNFQNGGTYSLKTLAEAQGFTGYTWELNHPDDIEQSGWIIYSYSTSNKFADGFAYKTSEFTIAEHNYVWISHTADNTYYDDREDAYDKCGSPETTCAYAKFTHKDSGKQFYFFVTHTSTYDHILKELGIDKEDPKPEKDDSRVVARRNRIVNNLRYFTSQKAGNLPYIVVGDFNFGPYYDTKKTKVQTAYTAMTNNGFTDAYDAVKDAGNLSGLYVNYPGTQTGSNWGAAYMTNLRYPQFRIDHIFLHNGTGQNLTAKTYKTVRTTYDVGDDTWCPSDHFPVVSTISFE